MKSKAVAFGSLVALVALGFQAQLVHAQNDSAPSVQVHMVIGNEAVEEETELPALNPANVQVRQGKTNLRVTQVIPAQGENAALQLFILIDETCDHGIGNNLNDIRNFVSALPKTTSVAIGYMSNANVQVTQDFTTDHSAAAKAIRLPRGTLSSQDSPYLSLISLLKRWPQQKVRREVIMVTDGIDRLRGTGPGGRYANVGPSRGRNGARQSGIGAMGSAGMATIAVDADNAINASQRYDVIVHGIYSPGVGRAGRNSWEAQMGQSGIGKIADETGGEYFALGYQHAVAFKPYLDRLQRVFNNQYYLVFQAIPGKKSDLQRVGISTAATKTEIAAANNVWVPVASEASSKGN